MFRTTLRVSGCLVALACAVWAQEYRSTITGRVTDPQGAVVPGVKIVARQVDTGANFETVSTGDGQYALPFLPPGNYRLTAEAAGFKRYVQDGFRVSTSERLPLDIKLDVGQVTETVTVTAEAALLETASASSGQVITTRQIENLPMNGRTPLSLAQIAFGVVPTSDPRFQRPFDNAGPSDFSMGGAPSRTNELLLDGSPDATRDNRVAFNPPVDTVEEVKVHTFESDAAYGHTGGGTVNVVSKSGANTFHGTAYDFNQVAKLAATDFFLNQGGRRKPGGVYNQWGVTAGGPLTIPKLIDGRNKMFFYVAYEGIKDSYPEPTQQTVPTQAQRGGDFSALLAVGGRRANGFNDYQLFNPFSGVREGTRVRRQPFDNNTIPQRFHSSIARAYLDQFYPQANTAGRADGFQNFLAAEQVRSDTFNTEIGRLDFNISDRHKLFFNFRHNERLENRGNTFKNIATGNFLGRINWGSMVDDVYTITPTTVLNTRLNWTRFTEVNVRPSDGFNFTTLGFPAYIAAASAKAVVPTVDLDQFSDVGNSGGSNVPFDVFQIFSSVTKIRGKHTLKVGADLRLYRESAYNYGNSSGNYQFRADWNRGPLDNDPTAPLGQDLAAFLMGLPTGGSFDINAARNNQAGYHFLFLQDDWRVKPNLTLNLGIRYERDMGTTERYNQTVIGYDFNSPSPISAAAAAAYARNAITQVPAGQFRTLGGLVFATAGDREVYKTQAHNFSPRLGFAWTPEKLGRKYVLRGGVGVFFFPIVTTGVFQSGFSQSTPVVRTLDGGLTPNATLANPFPTGIQQPTGSSLGLATFLGRGLDFTNTNPSNPYSIRWDLNIQRELPFSTVLEIGYIGNHAVRLTLDRQLNFVPRQYFSTSPTRDNDTINLMTANVTNPFAGLIPGTGLDGTTTSRNQLVRPFPHFTGVTARGLNDSSSYFHMLQVRAEKRFSRGLSFVANYQWSKLTDKRSRLNDFDDFMEKRPAGEDRPHRLVYSTSWDLPLGKGRRWANTTNPVLSRLIGGWNVNGIYTYQPSGGPLGWGNMIYFGGDLNYQGARVDGTFDTSRFERRSAAQLSQNVRTFPSRFNDLRADGPSNIDASVIKNTSITEKINLQYRCEFFNALNHPTFNGPNLDATSTSFSLITGQSNLPRIIQMALRLQW